MSIRRFCRFSGLGVALTSLFALLSACAGSTPPPTDAGRTTATANADDADTEALPKPEEAEEDADGTTADGEVDVLSQHPNAELALARLRTLDPASHDAAAAATTGDSEQPGVRIEIGERGPGLPWTLALVNVSPTGQRLQGDPRLLRFEVHVPGRKTPVECALPKTLQPARPNPDFELTLAPGEAAFESFDPRLYCFAQNGQSVLVPGAIVTAHFGWKKTTKVRWEQGKRLEIPDPKPPFVTETAPIPVRHRRHAAQTPQEIAAEDDSALDDAELADGDPTERHAAPPAPHNPATGHTQPATLAGDDDHEDDDDADAEEDDAEDGHEATAAEPASGTTTQFAARQQVLSSTPFALGSDYASWARDRLGNGDSSTEPLELRMEGGSDVDTDQSATVVVALKNKSTTPAVVFIRRELVSYEVMGPDGLVHCDAKPDDRSPDALAFTTLMPGKSLSMPSRLIELCPRQTFARAGLYLVHARFDATDSGAEAGVKAFVGSLSSAEPATVRIQTGERPLFEDYHMSLAPTELGIARPEPTPSVR